jgi:hypothetical protein
MVEMGGRQNDVRAEGRVQTTPSEAMQRSAAPTDPLAAVLVIPCAVAKVMHLAPVRTPAPLATTFGTFEADHSRELRPVNRVQVAELRTDRHQAVFRKEHRGLVDICVWLGRGRGSRYVRRGLRRTARFKMLVGIGKPQTTRTGERDGLPRSPRSSAFMGCSLRFGGSPLRIASQVVVVNGVEPELQCLHKGVGRV